jgi:hypothetical protein
VAETAAGQLSAMYDAPIRDAAQFLDDIQEMSESEIKDYVANLKNPKDPCGDVVSIENTTTNFNIEKFDIEYLGTVMYKEPIVDGFSDIVGQINFNVTATASFNVSCEVLYSCRNKETFNLSARLDVWKHPTSTPHKEINLFPKWMRKALIKFTIADNVGAAAGNLYKNRKYIKALASIRAQKICVAATVVSK